MNTRQLYYALQLSQSLNFSHLANELKISQPALSKQISSLENDLGVKLFDRNSTPLKLTAAGEYFIQEAKELLYKEEQLLRSMEHFKSGERGRLTIGISPFRSLYLMPPIIKQLQERYPGLQISLKEANSDTLRREVAEGKYDFAIINLPVDDSLLHAIPLEPDVLVLAIPTTMLSLLPKATPSTGIPKINFSDCKNLPFVVVGKSQEMRQLFDKLCTQAGFHPQITMEVVGLNTALSMVQAGIGATLLPLQFINKESFHDNISTFSINNVYFSRQPAIVIRKDQYMSEYGKYAISLLTNV